MTATITGVRRDRGEGSGADAAGTTCPGTGATSVSVGSVTATGGPNRSLIAIPHSWQNCAVGGSAVPQRGQNNEPFFVASHSDILYTTARCLRNWRTLALLILVAGAAGCGTADDRRAAASTPTPAGTVTIEEIERQNAARRTPTPTVTPTPTPAPKAAPKPRIVKSPIPFPASHKAEMRAYVQRHYGLDTYRLIDPKVIVEHFTVSDDAASAISTFSRDVADPELHELHNVCSHFVIDRDGTIYQLVPLTIMCRHTVGLNYTAIGIEHAGFTAQEVLDNPAEIRASLTLTRWLRCRFGIRRRDVIGHNESLSSPYHHEDVAALRTQTHGDWTAAEMAVYRRRLARRGGC